MRNLKMKEEEENGSWLELIIDAPTVREMIKRLQRFIQTEKLIGELKAH